MALESRFLPYFRSKGNLYCKACQCRASTVAEPIRETIGRIAKEATRLTQHLPINALFGSTSPSMLAKCRVAGDMAYDVQQGLHASSKATETRLSDKPVDHANAAPLLGW